MAVNGVGLIAFLYVASKTWREPGLRGVEIATSGVALVWALTALPVLLAFFAVNAVWLCVADRRRNKSHADWRPLVVAMGTVAVWVGAAVLDQFNH